MKTINSIPIGKIQRASKLLQTGAKVGVNYIKYYGDRLAGDEDKAKQKLDNANAEDIYDSLKNLKGSALKVAQMLSMEKNLLPGAYVEKFSLSQFSVPPLSPPLVIKTFKKYFGKSPQELFDRFDTNAINAASIGQVHLAEKNGKKLAVKIQYPGVAQSIVSDLALVKPIAIKMFNIQGKGSDQYFKEVREKLEEETDYILEVSQSEELAKACGHIPNISFPTYYPEFSGKQIITMDWMEGVHLSEYTASNVSREKANIIGQALWDFYMFQIHEVKKVHADPHPGNFLVTKNTELVVLDFGCVKVIPDTFYVPYFELAKKENLNNADFFRKKLFELEILKEDDSQEEERFFISMFHDMLSLFTQPFHVSHFDFSDPVFFEKIASLGERFSKDTTLRKMNGNRGSRHFIYMNRTFFGLYNLMHDLKADNIEINRFSQL
ncbi:AarF/ABC1/UbiB kinase family protein [Aquimarina sp. TRL1]|uniref:ABC1 kinase family protein n=1 Tax=Aquimarina sp. (strain TRL1) TaxID=2736252 RepID=UPI00158F203A|nr:AarF/UbiB family protein [Aquimarina sp. TRL1]QKX07033.1 AarF/ABC1/UbiB kinase family protein [Aquimarina sp. TRL1]